MKRKQSIASIRWDLALRYRLIETIALWKGRLTTGHLMQSFGFNDEEAYRHLRKESMSKRIPIEELAAQILTSTSKSVEKKTTA